MRRRSFTLLEVLAAVAILSIAMVSLIRSQTQSIANVSMDARYEKALFITENQLHWTMLDLNESEDWNQYANLTGEDGDYLWNVKITAGDQSSENGSNIVVLRIVANTRWKEGRHFKEIDFETWYLWGAQP